MAVIDEVFTAETIQRFASTAGRSTGLVRHRYDVLTAHGPFPNGDPAAFRLRKLRAERAAWEVYLDAAASTGVLDDDVIERLHGDLDHNLRSALAECLTSWLFAGYLRLPVTARPPGRGECKLELRVGHPTTPFNVEVKAPKEEPLTDGVRVWSGNGAPRLEKALVDASRQLPDDHANVLVLVPELRVAVSSDRYQFVQAFLGEFEIVVPIDMRTGGPSGPSENRFAPRGRFLRRRGKKDGDNTPANTRVSAVILIEEKLVDPASRRLAFTKEQIDEAGARGDKELLGEALYEAMTAPLRSRELMWVAHNVFVIHNPFATRPIDSDVFSAFPQFVDVERLETEVIRMEWTDGHRVTP